MATLAFCGRLNVRQMFWVHLLSMKYLMASKSKELRSCPPLYACKLRSFVEIDHEIFSGVILSLPLIQEGQLSVSVEKMCTSIG